MKSRSFKPVDMTVGVPWQQILVFTIPMLLGNIAQQLYNTVDSIVVGRYVGDNALAAVGSAGPIFNLLLVLFIGISMGASIVVSQYFGAKRREELSHSIGNCIMLIIIAALMITVLGLLIARPLLKLLNTPEAIIDWSASYLRILFIGAIGLGMYNILSGVLRGLGDAVSALIYLIVSTLLNIVLDIYFVASLGWGVEGVAWATIIAQGISGVLCILRLAKMTEYFDFGLRYIRWETKYAMGIIRLGIPSGITQAIISMAMILTQSLTNSFGETLIAANVIVQRIDGFAMLPNFSFGTAMTTYAGQNIGAGSKKRVQEGAKQGLILAMVVSVVLVALIIIFGHYLMGIFTKTEELIDLSVHIMRILAIGYLAMTVMQVLQGIMRGAGDTMTPMWISIFQTVCLRVPMAYLLVHFTKSSETPLGNSDMIFVSLTLTWVITACISVFFYKKGKWKDKAIL